MNRIIFTSMFGYHKNTIFSSPYNTEKVDLYNNSIVFRSTKIRPQAKIDNFAFKNSNIII